ncbi:MAG: hypothetical protein AABZ57_05700 [Candidatus Margulisiibacteriota bacterium]
MASTAELTRMAAKAFGLPADASGRGDQLLSALGGQNNEVEEVSSTSDLAKLVVNQFNSNLGGKVDQLV